MPDLAGLAKSAAIERLQKLGLNLGSVYEKDSSSEPGTVLSHDPATGTKITRGQVIDLIVSRGGGEPDNKKVEETPAQKKYARVPDVYNAGLGTAENSIENRGFYVGSVTYQESSQAEGTVISQYPAPDSEIEVGSYVDLVIATPPAPQTPPEPVQEPEPEQIHESEPVKEPEPEYQPQSTEFPDIPVQNDVPSREDDQSKGR